MDYIHKPEDPDMHTEIVQTDMAHSSAVAGELQQSPQILQSFDTILDPSHTNAGDL